MKWDNYEAKHHWWKEKKKLYIRLFFFFYFRRSCVFTWDLNQGTRFKTLNRSSREGRVKIQRGREKGLYQVSQRRGLKIQAHTHSCIQLAYTVWSPYNRKSCFIIKVENNTTEKIQENKIKHCNLVSRFLSLYLV